MTTLVPHRKFTDYIRVFGHYNRPIQIYDPYSRQFSSSIKWFRKEWFGTTHKLVYGCDAYEILKPIPNTSPFSSTVFRPLSQDRSVAYFERRVHLKPNETIRLSDVCYFLQIRQDPVVKVNFMYRTNRKSTLKITYNGKLIQPNRGMKNYLLLSESDSGFRISGTGGRITLFAHANSNKGSNPVVIHF